MSRAFATVIALLVLAPSASADPEKNWGQWRGPLGNGIAPKAKPPLKWADDKNIRWKVELPGQGQSTPIVWGDVVFIQAAVPAGDANAEGDKPRIQMREGPAIAPAAFQPEGRRPRGPRGEGRRGGGRGFGRGAKPTQTYGFVAMAFDRKNGKKLWEKTVRSEVPHEGSHSDGSLASSSPVTDGRHLYAYFGSRGLYCMDMDGKVLWEKDFGDMQTRNSFGEGSSPALFGDTLIVNWDHEGDSFIVALDAKTGDEKWRKSRDESTTWVTPLVVTDDGAPQVIVPASNRVRSYDLASGEVRWECGGLGANCVPTALTGFGLAIVMSGHRNEALLAIRYKGASGDLTDTDAVVWRLSSGTPYVPSPILYGDNLYLVQKNTNILSCYDAKTGEPRFERERLDRIDGIYSSLVAANGHIYVVGRNGTTCVLKDGGKFDIVATNALDDDFSASPAIVGSELFLRGKKHLYCIAD